MHSRAKKKQKKKLKRTQSVLWETHHITTHPKVKSMGATEFIFKKVGELWDFTVNLTYTTPHGYGMHHCKII